MTDHRHAATPWPPSHRRRRRTPRSAAILAALEARDVPVSAQRLHADLHHDGQRLALATVYRTLHALAADGVVHVFHRHGEDAFRHCGPQHHHHFICHRCDRVIELQLPEVEASLARVVADERLAVHGHDADLYGTCSDCT
jgi:Fur family ferric uptake transcriptional regulator